MVLVCGSLSVGIAAGEFVSAAPSPVAPSIVDDVNGVITAVDLEANTFTVTVAGEVTPTEFSITEKTLYTLDGKASTKAEALKVGNKVKVTHNEKIASSVSATTPQ